MRPRALLPTVLLALAAPLPAQTAAHAPDSLGDAFARATTRARAVLAADAGGLWGARMDTLRWMGVAGRTVLLTEDPHRAGYERATSALWTGPLPDGISPANTSVDWAQRRWAMVILPLPGDSLDATRLLIHEASHVMQPSVLPSARYGETGAGSDLLDRPEGRIWLRLEWRALAAALDAKGDARRRATLDALAFRARRLASAAPVEATRERGLEIVEGLPEYTAWALTGGGDTSFARNVRDGAERAASYVRTFAYMSGPAYAFLLDGATKGAWRTHVREASDLGASLARAAGAPAGLVAALEGDSTTTRHSRIAQDAERAGARYGLASLRAEENGRWTERERTLADLRARFVDGPTLRLRPREVRISFDYRGQVSLGGDGTVMPALTWRGDDGAELVAPDGALVSSDWKELRVPLDSARVEAGTLAERLQLTGRGWRLVLPAGWVASREGASLVLAPK